MVISADIFPSQDSDILKYVIIISKILIPIIQQYLSIKSE